MPEDIYAIAGRIKNIIAMEDMALSPVGTILVNYFSLTLKDLYDFSETLSLYGDELRKLLAKQEQVPMLIIKASTPEGKEKMSLYDQIMKSGPEFESLQEALDFYEDEYEYLGRRYGMSGDDFWAEAESSPKDEDGHSEIRKIRRSIQMCHYLIEKNKSG